MTLPKLINAINAPFPVTVEAHFDIEMLNDSVLVEPSNYLFNKGAYTTKVVVLNDKHVRLIVQNLFEYDSFTLTVQNVKSSTGEVINSSFDSMSFAISRPNIPDFALAISATNGRLKSGINVLKIDEDDDRWYVMTESGVDVIDRVSLTNIGFVLDGYGFNAICVTKS